MTGIYGERSALLATVPLLIILCIIYMIPVKKRKHYIRNFIASVCVICAAALTGAELVTFTAALTIMVYISFFLLMVLLVWSVCSVTLAEAVYCAACAYLSEHFVYSFTVLVGYGIGSGFLPWWGLYYGTAICISVLFYFIFARNYTFGGKLIVNSVQTLLLMVVTLSGSIILSHMSTVLLRNNDTLFFIVTRMYAMLCCITALWAQYNKAREMAVQEQVMAERELRRQQTSQFESYQENVELINYKCHDIRQQVAAIRNAGAGTVPEEMLAKVEESVMIYDAYVKTGNEVLDTILTEKNLWCEKQGITMACIVDGKCFDFMDTVDLYAIFGNALTNAIESVSKIEDADKRMISVMAFERMNVLFIQFENYYESELICHGELPETTKVQDGTHGYGLKSIRYSAERYDGCMTVETEDNIFTLRISIPLM